MTATRSLRQCVSEVSTYLLMVVGFAALGPLQFGFHLAELNAPHDVITCAAKLAAPSSMTDAFKALVTGKTSISHHAHVYYLPDCIQMHEAEFALVSAMYTLGGFIGALSFGPLSSAKGRVFAMRLTSLLFLVGSFIEAVSNAIPVLAFGRVLAGIGAGAATVIVPIYISEVAPPSERGLFGAMTQISTNIGILLSQTLGFFLSYSSTWRWILGTGVIVAGGHVLGLLVVPESPAWLAANDNVLLARKNLQRLRGKRYDISEEVAKWGGEPISAEVESLLNSSPAAASAIAPTSPRTRRASTSSRGSNGSARSSRHMGFFQVARDPLTRPAVIACVGVMCAQQLCGINSIVVYSVSLLDNLLPMSSALLTILVSAVNLFTTIACSPLPDKLGRKACLLLSITGQGSSALILAVSIIFHIKWLSAFAVLAFVAFFAVGLGPVPFILASELVGQEAVGATQSWCLASNYIATFLVVQFFPIINDALNFRFGSAGWVYFIFAGLAALSGIFVMTQVPETKGKRDADEVWGRERRLD
ncbi:major facilitator superfamily domain-containing protein [Microdochium bolleyi]|uniref:Major facilitator superfamily domain-containing protein n=1 Tax=Microdochium bolleyi TaxID=196109 RepID=A0A136ISK1_9PEZI|nr:major facilitator superfamily domain-containing protein [Microdochium bolleyi]